MKTIDRLYQKKILDLLARRQDGKTICPSEVLPPTYKKNKTKMEAVRVAARSLAKSGKIEIMQKGRTVDPAKVLGPIRLRLRKSEVKPSVSRAFDYTLDYSRLNLRKRKSLYRVGKGEQGVLLVEPYKSEILPFWKFRTPAIAKESAKKILTLFAEYGENDDFIGMDMARKFLQMGYTRSRRYANHASGQKYVGAVPLSKKGRSGAHGRLVAASEPDAEKAKSAEIFRRAWKKAEADANYRALKADWKSKHG